MTIQEIKKTLDITDADIAKAFSYKNAHSYSQSARKAKIENGIIDIYKRTLKSEEAKKEEKESTPDPSIQDKP